MLIEQRRKWLGGDVQLLAHLAGSSNANECGRAGLDDIVARRSHSEVEGAGSAVGSVRSL